MYSITCAVPGNREPWQLPISKRINTLLTARKSGKKIALMLYQKADTSTFRYRCYNVYQSTLKSTKWQAVYFFMEELDDIMLFIDACALLILTRIRWYHCIDDLVQKARKASIPVLFDIDDLVFNLDYLKLVTNTLNVKFTGEDSYDYWFAYISRIQYTASIADGFITTNSFLGYQLSKKFGKSYQIIENSLNQEQMSASNFCCKVKESKKYSPPFSMGYFSGTPSHNNDFKMIYHELIQLLEDYPDMILRVVGFMELPEEMKNLIKQGRVILSPLVDFLELQKLIAQVDVNIVPLAQNTFTNCKSELKFFEAAAVNTITVATPTYAYCNAIENGKSGFLCQPGQWYDTVVKMYNNHELSGKIARDAKEYCINRYYGDHFAKEIEEAYDFFSQ